MQFFLHIGHPKTGTSHVQHTFGKNRAQLAAAGVLYPESIAQRDAHHEIAIALSRRKRDDAKWVTRRSPEQVVSLLDAEIDGFDGGSVVLSSELFFRMRPAQALIDFVNRWATSIEVVAVLRRQDAWLESGFAHRLSTGVGTASASEFLRHSTENRTMDFHHLLAPWWSAVGEEHVHITPMEPGGPRTDAVEVLRELIGAEMEFEPSERANDRLSRDTLELLLAMPPEKRLGLRRDLRAWTAENPEPRGWEHFYSCEERSRYLDLYLESNAEVARIGRTETLSLFAGRPTPPESEYPGLSVERRSAIAAFVRDRQVGRQTSD